MKPLVPSHTMWAVRAEQSGTTTTLDLTELVCRLYARMAKDDRPASFAQRLRDGLHRLLPPDATVRVDENREGYMHVVFDLGAATPGSYDFGLVSPHPSHPPHYGTLVMLEEMGFVVLSRVKTWGEGLSKPVAPGDVLGYHTWRKLGTLYNDNDDDWGRPFPTTTVTHPKKRKSTSSSTVHTELPWLQGLADMLACYRALCGPVGLWWLTPLLCAMYGDAIGLWSNDQCNIRLVSLPRVDCLLPRRRSLCPGVARGCRLRFYTWSPKQWAPYHPLVRFIMSYQCQRLTGLPGSLERLFGERDCRGHEGPPAVDWSSDNLHVLTAANGVPLATAGVPLLRDDVLYVGGLCSVTDSGGGTLMLDHLYEVARTLGRPSINLRSKEQSVAFYKQYGFVANQPNDPLDMTLRSGVVVLLTNPSPRTGGEWRGSHNDASRKPTSDALLP